MKEWRFSLVGQIETCFNIDKVREAAAKTWNPMGSWKISYLEKNCVLIKLDNLSDLRRIWSGSV